MNIVRTLKTFSVITVVASAFALGGCAVQGPENETQNGAETAVRSPSQACADTVPSESGAPSLGANAANAMNAMVGLGPEDILTAMAQALTQFAVKQAMGQLFPNASLDVDKLLGNIDAATRQALFDEAMRHDKTFLDAALIVLKNAEIAKATIGQPDAKTGAQIYQEIVNSSTLNNVNDVVASTGGDSASVRFQRGGLRLYALGQQITANRLMLQIQLQPSTATTDRAVLVATLRDARAHVIRVVNEYRTEELKNRLDLVRACEVYDVRPDYIHMETLYSTRFHEEAEGKYWGYNASYDRATALGRCEADRDGHMQRVATVRTQQLNSDYTFELKLADEWAKTADALEKKTEAESTLYSGLDFGGMWGYVQDSASTPVHPTNNPFTGAPSCPPGYEQTQVAGKYDVDYNLFQCTRPSNGVAEPIADFGGMYGNFDYREARFTGKNPLTGASSCPAGFTAYKVLGNFGGDSDLYFCGKAHVAGTKPAYTFGGLFSRIGGYTNPATKGASCATGFLPNQVWGSNGTNGWKVDQAIDLCTVAPK